MRTRVERTETATTAHGSVDYEVVECCSCGNDIAKDDAKRMVVGELRSTTSYTTLGKERYTFRPGTITEGYVCRYCRNDPAGLPEGSYRQTLSQIDPMLIVVSVFGFTLLSMILVSIAGAML